jgi:tetraacyldisaccharide 4'-kinase
MPSYIKNNLAKPSAQNIMANWLQKQWASVTLWHILLIPLSWVFGAMVYLRAKLYKTGWLTSIRLSVPVIVVGNINVGGTGKTPFVIWLAEQLRQQGYTPAIISRGYGGSTKQVAEVFANSNPAEVGDEPVLIAKRTNCPMFVGANRVAAGLALLQAHPQCNVIISDDGLQHYRLQRDVEIAVIASEHSFGNGALLPAGSLRELITRLNTVDAIVSNGLLINGAEGSHLNTPSPFKGKGWGEGASQNTPRPQIFPMQLTTSHFYNVANPQITSTTQAFSKQNIVAIAGIGNPERFFNQLTALGLQFEPQAFADHHAFTAQDLAPYAHKTILMTEKDAVKCRAFAMANAWALPVNAVVSHDLLQVILNKLKAHVTRF